MANEQRPKGECPFCGSEAYECITKWMGDGQYRRAAAYYRCRKCYARGPVISSEREYDVRNERPDSMLLQLRASAAWRGDVADCELAEMFAAYAQGDNAQAVEECYDTIAVLLRAVDVIEGRQAVGKAVKHGK